MKLDISNRRLEWGGALVGPKVSIITVCYNAVNTIRETIESVLQQNYPNIEYIIIDGASKDGTREIIGKFKFQIDRIISEPDKGIYNAMNKGIKAATGEMIAFINADDAYIDNDVVANVMAKFVRGVDAVHGNLVYVNAQNGKIVRSWKSRQFIVTDYRRGYHPAHPTLFIRKCCYDTLGTYDESMKIAADYDLMLRFFYRNKIRGEYLNKTLVKMKTGGVSNRSLKTLIIKTMEDYNAIRRNGAGGIITLISKNVSKLQQFLPNRIASEVKIASFAKYS